MSSATLVWWLEERKREARHFRGRQEAARFAFNYADTLIELAGIALELQSLDPTRLPVGCCTMPVGVPSGGHVRNCPFDKLDKISASIEKAKP